MLDKVTFYKKQMNSSKNMSVPLNIRERIEVKYIMILEAGYNKNCNSLLLLCAIILQCIAIMVLHNFLSFTTLSILCSITPPPLPRTTSKAHLHKIISRLLAVSILTLVCLVTVKLPNSSHQ